MREAVGVGVIDGTGVSVGGGVALEVREASPVGGRVALEREVGKAVSVEGGIMLYVGVCMMPLVGVRSIGARNEGVSVGIWVGFGSELRTPQARVIADRNKTDENNLNR